MPGSSSAPFGDLLRQYRLAAGLTQEGLAERAGMSVHGIQKLERGATHLFRDTALRLERALQLEQDDRARFLAAVRPVRRHGTLSVRPSDGAAQHGALGCLILQDTNVPRLSLPTALQQSRLRCPRRTGKWQMPGVSAQCGRCDPLPASDCRPLSRGR
jgi:transcriptional regulator with XRE-family HTH domain